MHSSRPADIAARVLGTHGGAVVSVESIKHGLTNESWLVRTDADAIVVRLSNAAERELQIDRDSEAVVLEAVAQAGIGPPVLLCDRTARILVTRHAGDTWTADDALRDQNVERLGGVLRRLHRLHAPPGVRRVDLATTVAGYLRTLDERGIQCALTARPIRDCADQIALTLRADAASCLCHNDVHHLNIVDAGELRLIDWEYAGVGEPLFDLASVCVYHRYDRARREQLLSAYGSPTDSISWRRLELACWLFDYVRDLWMAVREADSG